MEDNNNNTKDESLDESEIIPTKQESIYDLKNEIEMTIEITLDYIKYITNLHFIDDVMCKTCGRRVLRGTTEQNIQTLNNHPNVKFHTKLLHNIGHLSELLYNILSHIKIIIYDCYPSAVILRRNQPPIYREKILWNQLYDETKINEFKSLYKSLDNNKAIESIYNGLNIRNLRTHYGILLDRKIYFHIDDRSDLYIRHVNGFNYKLNDFFDDIYIFLKQLRNETSNY